MESARAEAGEHTDEVTAPAVWLVQHMLSTSHMYCAELRERIDTLSANLAEAERAVAIYQELAQEPR